MGAPGTAISAMTLFPGEPEGAVPAAIDIRDEGWKRTQATRYPGITFPEYLAMWWLETKAHLEEFVDFFYQANPPNLGAYRVDFLLVNVNPEIVIEVEGAAFHDVFAFGNPVDVKAYDQVRYEVIRAAGYTLVRAREQDLITRLDTVMQAAVQGVQLF